jgi:hypothetical protein
MHASQFMALPIIFPYPDMKFKTLKMKKNIYLSALFALFILCVDLLFAQNNRRNQFYEGNCKEIIRAIQKEHRNDSIAIEVFKNQYEIITPINLDRNLLLRKNYAAILQYFNTDEGRECVCRSRVMQIELEPYLLHKPELKRVALEKNRFIILDTSDLRLFF